MRHYILLSLFVFFLTACGSIQSATTNTDEEYVTISLLNSSATSIPLIIPGVMNPNLSPYSTSGVRLKMGQEVLFKVRGRKYILFIVDESIEEGDKIQVSTLLKQRKKELGL